MGRKAAKDIAKYIRKIGSEQEDVRIVFAAAPSQLDLFAALIEERIDWTKVTAFHMDEYIGLNQGDVEQFGQYLTEHLFKYLSLKQIHLMSGKGDDEELKRYAQLIQEQPIDLVCLGIGENGHLAFNDPPVADFSDKQVIKVVELDEVCRQQQVNDGCFASLNAVPTNAVTLTIPTLLSAKKLFCIVPGVMKEKAVTATIKEPISTDWPSTILRTHKDVVLYADRKSFPGVQ